MKLFKQILEDKEKEISDTKNQLRQKKKEAIHDSVALLAELGGSFTEGFDDALYQVKTSYPDLDVSHVTIDSQAQTLVQPVYSKSTDKLFADMPS